MVGADDLVLSIIIISSVQNFLFDLFGEVLLEYGVVFTRQTSVAADSVGLPTLIEQLALTPQLIDKLSAEQLELLNTMLVSMQSAG